jgi:glycosyltransferase involved in cell wall biosynthesis
VTATRIDTLHAVTSPLSLVLLRGQLRYLQQTGFHPAALSAPGSFVEQAGLEPSTPLFTIAMERDVSPLRDFVSLVRISKLLRQLRPTICNASTPKAGLLVMLAAWLARVPCRVYTLRGLRAETASGVIRMILLSAERVTSACAHRVICVSPSLRDRAVDLKLANPRKTVVLGSGSSNGIDASRFVPTQARKERAAEIRHELKLNNRLVIGFIGRFTHDKGVGDLTAAFDLVRQQFPDASLLLIGSYEQGNAIDPEVRARIAAGLDIVAIPFQHDIAPYYLAMDVFVLPTYREGFPNTVLEAQAAERPVVTTQATGAIDSVLDGSSGILVPIGDSRALADAIVNLLANPDLGRRMGQVGRKRVEQEFRQEIVWSELVDLYQELLRERGLQVPVAAVPEEKLCLQKQ